MLMICLGIQCYFCLMNLKYKNGEEFFFKYNQLFHVVLAISLLPFGIIWLAKKRGFQLEMPSDIIQYAGYAVLGLVIFFLLYRSFRDYKESYKTYSKDWTLREKLDFFYRINYKKYLYLGIATVIAVVGYLVDKSYFFIIIYVFLLFSMSVGRPAERKIEKELAMSKEEKEVFRKKQDIP